MDQVLRGVPLADVYIDDDLFASSTPEQELDDLRIVFAQLASHSIVIVGVPELDITSTPMVATPFLRKSKLSRIFLNLLGSLVSSYES